MKDAIVYDTADLAVRQQMDEEIRLIEAMPVVRSLGQVAATGGKGGGFQAFLWCHAGRETGSKTYRSD